MRAVWTHTVPRMDSAALKRNTIIGLVASVALAAVKLLAGLIGNSSALVADAVESMADTIGSVIVWWGISVGDRDPDPVHPYGYGRAEAVAAMIVGGLLLIAALLIFVRACGDMLSSHAAPAAWTLAVLAGVIVVKEGLFRLVLRGADTTGSDAARADAWHHRSDAITSAAAFIGIAIAVWGPGLFNSPRLVFADEIAAILASIVIIITAVRLFRPSLRELLDANDTRLAEAVRAAASGVEGVRLVEIVHARKSGRGYLVDMHLHVNPDLSVHDGHALAGLVKATVRRQLPTVRHVLIHVEPGDRIAGPDRVKPRGLDAQREVGQGEAVSKCSSS